MIISLGDYWQMYKRRCIINAQLAGCGISPVRYELIKSLNPLNDKYQAAVVKLSAYNEPDAFHNMDPDYTVLARRNKLTSLSKPRFGCSSMRADNFQGRNFDWTLDYEPEFVIITPETKYRHATVGVADSMTTTWDDVKKLYENKIYNPEFNKLIYFTVDGINSAGVVCNLNVVPVGDNPNEPSNPNGTNYTFHTQKGSGKRRMGIPQLVRYILDYADNVEEAISFFNEFDLYATYGKMGKNDFAEEYHYMISDKDSTAIVEFVNEKIIVNLHKRENNWKCLQNGVAYDRLPIMTNFYVTNFDGDISNIRMKDAWDKGDYNHTLTPHAMGTERYVSLYNSFPTVNSIETMKTAMQNIKYTRGFDENDPFYTEFLDEYAMYDGKYPPLRISSPKDDFIGEGKVVTNMVNQFKDANSIEDQDERDKALRTAKPAFWQSINTSIYDIENKSLTLFIQEDYTTEFKFEFDGKGFKQTK